jgi:hypothetical protein
MKFIEIQFQIIFHFLTSTPSISTTASKIIEEILLYFKIAKTPSYVKIDYEDIEDRLLVASAKAINGLIQVIEI